MFGTLTHLIPTGVTLPVPPKDVPPSTPINFPQCRPQDRADAAETAASDRPPQHVASVLQGIIRPTEVTVSHLEALGSHVIPNLTITDLIPDPTLIPDFASWDALSADEAHAANESTRRKITTTALSPGCQTYLERKRELLIPNEAAYRAIRRIPAPKGQAQARLGNSYEFYRYLELLSTFWDDTSRPVEAVPKPCDVEDNKPGTDSPDPQEAKATENGPQDVKFYRTSAGHQMPPEYRQSIVTSLIKLIAYDFGCNVSAPRTEPRLYVTSDSPTPRSSYFSSGCTFIFRTPTTREAARAGIIEGPLAAVSARHTTAFPPARPAPAAPTSGAVAPPSIAVGTDRDSALDLAREIIAALITAQHRAREGREEKRIGEGAWWATKPRWGGGPGGPIGREVDVQSGADETIGDKDAPPLETPPASQSSASPVAESSRRPFTRPLSLGTTGTNSAAKGAKRLKKSGNLPMYDNYRMVRPPSAAWDKKTTYTAVGRPKGADYDDIFVVSALFHHVSVLRVRVPDRLLAVLDGQPDEAVPGKARSWGRLEVRRSKWYDLFQGEERLEAMKLIWGMMAYLMRAEEMEEAEEKGEAGGVVEGDGDVDMADT